MALPDSTLWQASRHFQNYLRAELQVMMSGGSKFDVLIGNPASVDTPSGQSHSVNLFFYLVEPAGFYPGTGPRDPWFLRLHCLITAFSDQEETVSAGENDLRLLGEVMRIFHEKPVLDPITLKVPMPPPLDPNSPPPPASNEILVRPQVVFQPLSTEDINHLWPTQGDVAYRPSVAYEMSLVPVLPRQTALDSPRVGSLGAEAVPGKHARGQASGEFKTAPVPKTAIDTGRRDWAPRICLFHGDSFVETLGLPTLTTGETLDLEVWVAGAIGSNEVSLRWEFWDRDTGWRLEDTLDPIAVTSDVIDPNILEPPETVSLSLPFPASQVGQVLLYAVREFERSPMDLKKTELRSNPILITLFSEPGTP